MNDKLVEMFPVTLWSAQLADCEAMNDALVENIQAHMKKEEQVVIDDTLAFAYTGENSYTSYNSKTWTDTLITPILEKFKSLVVDEVHAYANELKFNLEKSPIDINLCCFNVFRKGALMNKHNHPNSVISGIYYVRVPENSGTLTLHAPGDDLMYEPEFTEHNRANSRAWEITPNEGMMLLFRSWVPHSMKPSKSDEDRIAVVFNFGFR